MNNDLLARRLKPPSPAPATPIFAPAEAPQALESSPAASQPQPPAAPVHQAESLVFAEPSPLAQPEAAASQTPAVDPPAPDKHLEAPGELAPTMDPGPAAVADEVSEALAPVWDGIDEPAWDGFDLQEAAAYEPPPEAIWEVDQTDREDGAAWQVSSIAETEPAPAADVTPQPEVATELEAQPDAFDAEAESTSPLASDPDDPRLSLFASPDASATEHEPEQAAAAPGEPTNGHAPWPLETLEAVAVAEPTSATVGDERPLIDDSSPDEPSVADATVEVPEAEEPMAPPPMLTEPLVDPQIFETQPPPDEPPDDLLFGSWRSEPRGASVFGDMFAAVPPVEPAVDPGGWPPVQIDALPLHDRPVPNGDLALPGELLIAWPDAPRVQTFWPELPAELGPPPAATLVPPPADPAELPASDPLVVESQPTPPPAFIPPPRLETDLPVLPPNQFDRAAGYAPPPPALIFTDPPAAPAAPAVAQPSPAVSDGAFTRFTNQATAFAERIPDHWSLMSQPLTSVGDEAAVHEPWHVQASALTVVMAIAVIGLVLTFIYLFTPLMR